MDHSTTVDPQKARELFIHCAVASKKFSHRDMSKRELLGKLKKLSQFSVDRAFRQHIADLELHINDLVKKERRILTASKKQQETDHSLQERINSLEEKLSRYVEQRAIHEGQIKELETKVTARMKQRQFIHELKQDIRAMEDLYDEVSQERYRYEPSQIKKIENRLASLKKRLADLEKRQH